VPPTWLPSHTEAHTLGLAGWKASEYMSDEWPATCTLGAPPAGTSHTSQLLSPTSTAPLVGWQSRDLRRGEVGLVSIRAPAAGS
jgi:hypothetical protein